MSKVLVISGHTDLNDSVANKIILEKLAEALPDAKIEKLDELYPTFDIDVAAEQAALVDADVIVLQFPLFWYSAPSALHRWMEQTFQHGFSHGSKGKALVGKKLVVSVTAGAPEEIYTVEQSGHTIEDYLFFVRGACALTGMEYAGTVFTGGVSYQMRTDPEQLALIEEKSAAHAARLLDLLATL